MAWTEERVTLLRKLWAEWSEREDSLLRHMWLTGATGSEIVDALNAQFAHTKRSRSAVMGRIHRLGLRRGSAVCVRRVRRKAPRVVRERAPPLKPLKPYKPPPKPKPARVNPGDPAARAAEAILAAAIDAERRRACWNRNDVVRRGR